MDSLEKQRQRDRMIIKFREDRISKLEVSGQTAGSYTEDKSKFVQDLKKELALLKEAADSNVAQAKLFSEKQELQNQYDNLLKESKVLPDSLNAHMRSLNEMMENLN